MLPPSSNTPVMPTSLPLRRFVALLVFLLLFPGWSWAQQQFTECLPPNVNDANILVPTEAPVELESGDIELAQGDEIALFSNDGTCAGVAVVDTAKSAVVLTVANVDTTAGLLSGYEAGEPLKYRFWRKSTNTVMSVSSVSYECTLSNCRTGGGYEKNAVYEVKAMEASSTLPVELTDFTANPVDQGVRLTWRTEGEHNTAGFKVQHQERSSASWTTLGFVEGAGTTSSPQYYEYTAEQLSYGVHHFRLKQVDRTGATHNSRTVDVELVLDQTYDVSGVYPNPVRQSGTVDITVKESQRVVVQLYDLLGRLQATVHDGQLNANQTLSLRVDASRLPSGKHFLRVKGEEFVTNQPLTIVK